MVRNQLLERVQFIIRTQRTTQTTVVDTANVSTAYSHIQIHQRILQEYLNSQLQAEAL